MLADQHDLIRHDSRRRREFGANRLEQHAVRSLTVVPADFGDEHEPLAAAVRDAKRGREAVPQTRMTALGCDLEVVRIVVAAVENDEIFEAPRDDQLPLLEDAEIAGPQIVGVPADELSVKGGGARLGSIPVSRRDAPTSDPDLADLSPRALDAGVRIDDAHVLFVHGLTGRDENHGVCVALDGRPELARFKTIPIGDHAERCSLRRSARNEQRSLGKTVARQDDIGTQSALRERRDESRDRVGSNRLGAVERRPPRGKVERATLGLGDALNAEVVGEVRCAARRCAR